MALVKFKIQVTVIPYYDSVQKIRHKEYINYDKFTDDSNTNFFSLNGL